MPVQSILAILIFQTITGVEGFEPTNGGVKVHSLTTWRHPKRITQFKR